MSKVKICIEKALQKIEYTFRWSGMNLDSTKRTPAENLRLKIWFWFNFVWINTDYIAEIWWFIQGTLEGKSITTLTYAAPCITFTFLSIVKSTSIFFYEDKLNDLITSLKELEKKENDRPIIAEKDEIIKSEIKFLNVVLKVYDVFNWLLILTFPWMPLAVMAVKYYNTNEVVLILPVLTSYPFNVQDIRIWPFVYAHQVWSVMLVVIENSGPDYLFYICSTHIRIQYRLLRQDIERVIQTNVSNGKFCESEVFNYKLTELINRHQELLRLVEPLETINAKSTLFNFVTSSIVICLTLFNVTTIDDKAFVVSFLCFLLMSLIQIFFLCFYGDLLMRSSMEVSDAVYNCKWYLAEASIGKKLRMIQLRAQKPSKVTALGFADVNLKAFTRILSTAWSYFALLNTVYTEPRE